jgi:hypothetical protein
MSRVYRLNMLRHQPKFLLIALLQTWDILCCIQVHLQGYLNCADYTTWWVLVTHRIHNDHYSIGSWLSCTNIGQRVWNFPEVHLFWVCAHSSVYVLVDSRWASVCQVCGITQNEVFDVELIFLNWLVFDLSDHPDCNVLKPDLQSQA